MKDKFAINIAVLGCEDTGKSTVVNAICGAPVTEADFGRTTECINVFRLVQRVTDFVQEEGMGTDGVDEETTHKRPRSPHKEEPQSLHAKRIRSTFKTIKDLNDEMKKGKSSDLTKEYEYTVPVAKLPITMRSDAQLHIIESPGLNVKNADNAPVRAYFEQNWNSLDAVLVIIDAKHSADVAQQEESIRFVHNLLKTVKKIPCYFACNKVDNPDGLAGTEDEQKLEKTRKTVENIFGVGCRVQALETYLDDSCSQHHDVYPVFVPTSAKTAFLFRAGSAMTEADFNSTMRPERFYDIGARHFGLGWRDMSQETKAAELCKIVKDESRSSDYLRLSGFEKLLLALEKGIGGDRAQLGLIQRKLKAELSEADFASGNLEHTVRSIDDKLVLLNQPKDHLKEKLWASINSWKMNAIDAFKKDCMLEKLAFAAQKLIEFQRFCGSSGDIWKGEIEKTKKELATLVKQMLVVVNNRAAEWSFEAWKDLYRKFVRSGGKQPGGSGWSSLSPIDWQKLLNSILLLTSDEFSCSFGHEIVLLQEHKARFEHYATWCPNCDELGCSCDETESLQNLATVTFKKGSNGGFKMHPSNEAKYAFLVRIRVPQDYKTSPKHFAHVPWLYCASMKM
ncbi:expressed unknown protein [Seminavis robusta]|uniref:Dynamin N-terminal domain-containing protein n=1 Tax=Seminavis robusta TaxID=568900 RepID=A0A9N8H3B1_9STRA|nr:expressed unknown protein [Seminavis robusta]|eukprot:Sro56_g032670.1 n/a (622) ;mRNA; f:33921-35936